MSAREKTKTHVNLTLDKKLVTRLNELRGDISMSKFIDKLLKKVLEL